MRTPAQIFDLTGNYARTLGLLALSAVLALGLSLALVRRSPQPSLR